MTTNNDKVIEGVERLEVNDPEDLGCAISLAELLGQHNIQILTDFISQALEEQMKMVMECLPDKWLVLSHECIGTCDYRESETYNQCIDDFKDELKSKGLIK